MTTPSGAYRPPPSDEDVLDHVFGRRHVPSVEAIIRRLVGDDEPTHANAFREDVAIVLLRALTWCGTQEQREQAWAWVEDQRGNIEEMGT